MRVPSVQQRTFFFCGCQEGSLFVGFTEQIGDLAPAVDLRILLFEVLLCLFIFQQLRGSLLALILRHILKLTGQVIALVDGQFLLIKRLLDGLRSILVDLYDLAIVRSPKPTASPR